MNSTDKAFLPCRSLLHAWKIEQFRPVTDDEFESIPFKIRGEFRQIIVRTVNCVRCECKRLEYFGRVRIGSMAPFEKFSMRYTYPEGYLYHGPDRPSRAAYTTALFDQYK